MFLYTLWIRCLCRDISCQWLYPFDEQQFQTLSCVHYIIFSLGMLGLCIRALLLDHFLSRIKKLRVCLAYILLIIRQSVPYANTCLYQIKFVLIISYKQSTRLLLSYPPCTVNTTPTLLRKPRYFNDNPY